VVEEEDAIIEEIEREFNAIQFEKAKADLKPEAKRVLNHLADYLNEKPDIKVKIIGHTSSEGPPELHQPLSQDRAKACVDYLVQKGINQNRLQFEGMGSSQPIDPNNLEANRRTDFQIIK